MPDVSSFEILTDGMMGYIVSKQRVQVANLNPRDKYQIIFSVESLGFLLGLYITC